MAKTRKKIISIFFRILFNSLIITVASNLILAVLLYEGYKGVLDQIKPYLNPKSFQNVEANISTTWIIAGTSFIFIFLITVLLAVNSTSRLVIPIRKLVKVVSQVTKGNLQVKAKIKRNDEIGQLASAFNEMVVKLREARNRLEDERTVLEIQVNARTRQLREQAEALKKENEEKTKDLKERLEELERFHKLTVGRELRMIELKQEIKKLKKELEKYKS
ncbi:HAMP domain-containing protein [bacterium]|nr:HAMP domain-containing protein [bacterium]